MRVLSLIAITAMASTMIISTTPSFSFADESAPAPGQQTPGQQTPGQQTPEPQHPGQQDPGQQTPEHQCPGHQTPGHQCPGPQLPGDNHIGQRPPGCGSPECEPATKETCFNVACYYYDETRTDDFKSCRVVTRFNKRVTVDGGEVADASSFPENPQFALLCNEKQIYNGSAYRFTGLLETRIQGEMGPYPAILLPRGSLNAGFGDSGEHIATSILEVNANGTLARIHGTCQIWTGAPLL